ncbi:hypothetical protein BKA62DRAFT_689046 [Auriculariales sp. MPI-PUGE-AT-0066]|nr:hypothetical protein BKA62DRAFT_689046 [Auriculariales sp. MPI-PUGE-AT-0066]
MVNLQRASVRLCQHTCYMFGVRPDFRARHRHQPYLGLGPERHGGLLARTEHEQCTSDMFFCAGLRDLWLPRLTCAGAVVFSARWVLDSVAAGLPVPIADYVLDDRLTDRPDSTLNNTSDDGSPQDALTDKCESLDSDNWWRTSKTFYTVELPYNPEVDTQDAMLVESMLSYIPDASGLEPDPGCVESSTSSPPDVSPTQTLVGTVRRKPRKRLFKFNPTLLPAGYKSKITFKPVDEVSEILTVDQVLAWDVDEMLVTRFVPGEEFRGRRFAFTQIE